MKLPALVLLALAVGLAWMLRSVDGQPRTIDPRTQTTYYANGQVDTECAVVDGRREGAFKRFYSDGSPMEEGAYADGKMEGEWTFWRRDGSVDGERSGTYRAGVRVSS